MEKIVNTTLEANQSGARVAALAGGGFVVVWKDAGVAGIAVRAQRFDATGTALGGQITVSDVSNPTSGIAVTGLADGSFYITWSQFSGPWSSNSQGLFRTIADVQGNVYAADGSFLRYQPVIYPFSTIDGNPAMAPWAGGAAVAWEVGGGGGVALRVFDANGAGEGVRTIAGVEARDPVVAVQPGTGTTVVVVRDSVSGRHIRIAFYNDTPPWQLLELSSVVIAPVGDTVGPPKAAWLAGGALAVAWVNTEAVFGAKISLRFALLRPRFQDGILISYTVAADTVVVPPEFSMLTLRALVALPAGGAVLAWDDGGGSGMKLQAVTDRGAPMGPEYRIAVEFGSDVQLAALPDGRVAVTWTGDGDEGDTDIHLQIIDPRNGIVTGGAAADTLYGHDLVNDEISGLGGNDTLYGLGGDDALFGGLGNDVLDGGRGADEMYGGKGDDTYILDQGGDQVFEAWNQGTDTLRSSVISIALAAFANVENAVLTGSAVLTATGTAGANVLDGAQNSAGNLLQGFGGNDTYIIGVGDVVQEAANAGTDTVQTAAFSIDLGLPGFANVENAILTGTLALSATGTAGDNRLEGAANSAANKLTGLGGNDTYVVGLGDSIVEAVGGGTDTVQSAVLSLNLAQFANVENATLTGALALSATGNAGANVLDGAQNSAANILAGLAGNDTYWVGAGDTVQEAVGGGFDAVHSALINLDLANFPNVEWLVLRGSLALKATGNDAGNIIDGAFNSAANVLTGLGGNDTYVVGAGDTVVEAVGGGTDQVQSWAVGVDLTKFANVENAALTGALALNLTGTAGANVLTGNAGANAIIGNGGGDIFTGLGGLDTMTGGAGADLFRFLAPADSAVGAGRDVIQGFNGAEGDRIDLSAIDANDLLALDQGFTWRGTSAFTGGRGELRYDVAGPDVIVKGTISGAAVAFEIRVAGLGVLGAGDFKL
jgi:Ca2+-binding RTX toxin-like protein